MHIISHLRVDDCYPSTSINILPVRNEWKVGEHYSRLMKPKWTWEIGNTQIYILEKGQCGTKGKHYIEQNRIAVIRQSTDIYVYIDHTELLYIG